MDGADRRRRRAHPPGDPTRRVAIVLDDQVISSPQVDPVRRRARSGIPGGTTQITGTFTADEAKELAVLIRGGALPVPVEVIEQRTVGPTLGAAAIEASAKAAVIGVALTGAVHHRSSTGSSAASRSSRSAATPLISYAALVALGATLTLPGLAGFVLAIGMAVDANVLVFERAREEYAAAADARACGRRSRPASPRRGARSSTPTSPRCSPAGCCSSSRRGRSAGSV